MKTVVVAIVAALQALASAAHAQGGLVVYPNKGQSQEQQDKDRFECHSWAVKETGFDPTTARAPSGGAPPPQRGGVVRGAAGGAAAGAVGGAIGGNAGKGAAIGAGVGATAGLLRQAGRNRQQAQAQQQRQAADQQQYGAYNRALGACLEGRGYTVR